MACKILLIDDEEAICNLIRLHFQTEGYLVYTAADAEKAARMLSLVPDLILLDINLPEIDGLAFCKKVRSHVDCPILFSFAGIGFASSVFYRIKWRLYLSGGGFGGIGFCRYRFCGNSSDITEITCSSCLHE